ncbi:hypothetical protein [Natronococcus pandeyae]|nr:hypothetical protein [Natronococcus pandeyae]
MLRVEVDPDQVQWKSNVDRNLVPVYGENAVVGELRGTWDLWKVPIEYSDAYQSLTEPPRDKAARELLASMEDGYKEQHELDGETRTIRTVELPDEPRLAVGRNNELIRWVGGIHRIAAAQTLGMETIPAYVVVWHPRADREAIEIEYAD